MREKRFSISLQFKPHFCLAILIIAGLLLVIGTALEKEGYHIDEIYTYILSNSYDANRISAEADVWDQWIRGDRLLEFVTVQRGEQFAYGKVYQNNAADAHPPFYYMLVHTICSLFPDTFSAWYGIGLNVVLSLAAQVLLYYLGSLVLKDKWWALLSVALWSTSAAFVDTAVYIRMYMLLTVWTLLLAIFFVKAYQEGVTGKLLAAMYAVTFLGTFTQYYLAVFAFSVTVIFGVYLLLRRQFLKVVQLGGVMLAAIITVFLVWPAGLAQITGSTTNNVGNEVFAGGALLRFGLLFRSVASFLRQIVQSLARGLMQQAVVTGLFAVGAVIAIVLEFCKKKAVINEKKEIRRYMIYLLSVALTFVLVAHISKKFIYIRYMYNIIPLGIASVLGVIKAVLDGMEKPMKRYLYWFFVGVSVLNFWGNLSSKPDSYTYKNDSHMQEIADRMQSVPVVVLSKKFTYIPTANFVKLLQAKRLYMTSAEMANYFDLLFTDDSPSATAEGVMLLIASDQYWAQNYDSGEVLDTLKRNTTMFSSSEYLGYYDFCDVYYLSK